MGVVRLNEEQLLLVENFLEKLDHMSEILDRMLQNPKKVQEPLVQCYDNEDEEEEAAESMEDSVEDTAKEKNSTIEVEEIIELPTEIKPKEITLLRLDLVVPESKRVKKNLEEQALPKVRLTKIDVEGANGDLVGILQLQSRAQGRSFNGALHPPRPANPFDEEEVNPFSKGSAAPGSKPRSPTLGSETFADTDPKLIPHLPSDFPLHVSFNVEFAEMEPSIGDGARKNITKMKLINSGKVGPRLVWQPPWKFSMDSNNNFRDSLSRESTFAKDKLVVEESNGDKEENPGRLSHIRKRSERLMCEKRCSSGLIALQGESGKLEHRTVMGSNLYSSGERNGIATMGSGLGLIPQLSLSLALFSCHNPILKYKRGIKEVSQFDVPAAVISNSLSFSWLVGCDLGRALLTFLWIQWMNLGYGRVMRCLVDARELFVVVVHGVTLHEFFRWIEKIEFVHGLACKVICDFAFGWKNFDEEGNVGEFAEKCKGKKFFAHSLFDILPLKVVFEPFDSGWKGNLVGIDCDGMGVMKYEIPDPYVEHASEENNEQCSFKRSLDIRLHSVCILELWAVGDGKTLNTVAFQNASVYLKSCADNGGVFVYLEYCKGISSLNGCVNVAHHPLLSSLIYGSILQMVESINTNIAFGTSENTGVVIDHGVIPIFIKLLEFPSNDVQAVLALGNVAGDSLKCCDIVLSHGVLMPLLAQFKNLTKLSMMRNAMWTLSDFCRGMPPPTVDQTRLSIPALGRLIHSIDEEILTDACWALSYLSNGTNDKIQAVIDAGVCH